MDVSLTPILLRTRAVTSGRVPLDQTVTKDATVAIMADRTITEEVAAVVAVDLVVAVEVVAMHHVEDTVVAIGVVAEEVDAGTIAEEDIAVVEEGIAADAVGIRLAIAFLHT